VNNNLSGLVGNTLVIYVVLRFSKMHTVTNMYILNLAVADECFLVGIPFLIVTMAMAQWPFGAIMCKIYYTTTSINQITSSIFLFVLSGMKLEILSFCRVKILIQHINCFKGTVIL
jgi:hypothetical protein